MQISYSIGHAKEILSQISTQIQHPLDAEFLHVGNETVEGSLFGDSLNEYLSIYGVSLHLHKELTVARSGTTNNELVIIDFQIDASAKLFVEDQETNQLTVGAYFASSDYASTASYSSKTDTRFISFIVDKNWLQANIHIKEQKLADLLDGNKTFFFFREIEFRLASEVRDVFNSIYGRGHINNGYLMGCAWKILSLYFDAFELDYDLNKAANKEDLKAIEKAKEYIDLNVDKKIEMKDLLDISAMSETKFRNLFQSIYDASPIDYYLKCKLWHAKSLIESGDLISTVVSKIGYSNHSYFTRSFKAEFGITPRKYKEEIVNRKDHIS
ncbi:MAG: AraC family transcriptional regulator [Bacteroidota bacterium]